MTGKQDLVFYDDGRIEMKGHNHGMYVGQYTLEKGNKLTSDFERLSKPVKFSAQIRGEKLTLLFPEGRKEVYLKK